MYPLVPTPIHRAVKERSRPAHWVRTTKRHNNPSSPFLNTASRGLPARAQVTFACDGKRSNETAPPKQNRLERGTQILRDSANKALTGPPALLSNVISN